ncbi:MAG TPA: hypothetical protein VGR89_15760 [Puia sp.]|nr:hypothetical protein [Puia sp.]
MKHLIATFIAIFGFTAASFAQTGHFDHTHPRRAQVNSRLANQNRRINRERAEGQISARRAAQLHRNDHEMRQEERDMARQNHGHITRQEQRTLNHQENANSRKIGH